MCVTPKATGIASFPCRLPRTIFCAASGSRTATPSCCFPIDQELHRRGHRFARYADDLIILVKSERAAQRVMLSITRYLETRLKLTVNPAKSRTAPMSECSFLGFTIKGNKIRWTDKALANFKHRVKQLTGRSWGVSMDYRLHQLGQYLRGWTAYFGISQYYPPGVRAGRLDQATHPQVLLEAVALLGAHQDSASVGLRREPEDGHPACGQQQELLAHGANPGPAAGPVQRRVQGARAGQRERPVVQGARLCHVSDSLSELTR